ncbi:hypothetical protein AC579_4760 [Pseudocercospora musae]|uniref:Uncharacterized protein n=1 Tax=Pseudocercospora musae TaxID=113226 RepID=A0A139IQ86_9PEZI|nr:hypothetical protein AC579_4760 [Pseudocercospora musae]
MWLIHTTTRELHEFVVDDRPGKYAILSHCWTDDEVSHRQYQAQSHRNGYGFHKIDNCCQLASDQGIKWLWIDTCCIDKSSSSELAEAINSMFSWYEGAEVCFVLLPDYDSSKEDLQTVHDCECHQTASTRESDLTRFSTNQSASSETKLHESKWFTRGWTLQELLAPTRLLFYDRNSVLFGCKRCLGPRLSAITKIDLDYLTKQKQLHHASIACRMSWASRRATTRVEDIAYALLGIFHVNMSLRYGEGTKAFTRLQELILQRSNDDSLFAWRLPDCEDRKDREVRYGLLAEHPADFAGSSKIVPVRRRSFPHLVTGRGIELFAPADLCSTVLESCWLGQYILRELDWSMRVRLACRDMSSSTTEKHSITLKIKQESSPLPTDSRLLYRRIDAHETLLTNYARFHSILILAFGRRGFYIAPTKTFERANYRLHDCPQAILLRLLSGLYAISLAGISTYATSSGGQENHMSLGMSWAILTLGLLMSHWRMTYISFVLIMAAIWCETSWTLHGAAIKILQDAETLRTSLTPGIVAVGAVALAVGYWLTAFSPMP